MSGQPEPTVENGRTKNSTRTCPCKACSRQLYTDAPFVNHGKATRTQTLAVPREWMSLQGVERVSGVHRK